MHNAYTQYHVKIHDSFTSCLDKWLVIGKTSIHDMRQHVPSSRDQNATLSLCSYIGLAIMFIWEHASYNIYIGK